MNRSTTAASPCPFCEAESRRRWPSIFVSQCERCSLLFRDPAPTPEELDAAYRDGWEKSDSHPMETGTTDIALARQYASRLAETLRVPTHIGVGKADEVGGVSGGW